MRTRIKICGFTRVDQLLQATQLGVDAVGLVFYPPSPRNVSIEQAHVLCRAIPPFVTVVGLFVDAPAEQVREVLRQVPLTLLQFHGDETPAYCQQFGWPYIKAVRVKPGLDLLQYATDFVSARGLLLDAYVAGVPGGTCERFDWTLIPADLPLPVVLSGGLDPETVTEAINSVHPWAVDVSSGVEQGKGNKDLAKMAAFIDGVRNADV
ncbi:MAG: phosphoribosylanthranilate isomerase [Neisseriaceae bacterium]|nr:MAG: phosphoribosylanthranilate isomerase [Neisseriaceae bacterium]